MASTQDDVVRVRLRYPDRVTFLQQFAPNVTRGGVFLASREVRPVGAVVRFEISLRGDGPLLSGEGKVAWVRAYNPAEPNRPYGLGVQFIHVDPNTRATLDDLLAAKEQTISARTRPAMPGDPRQTLAQPALAPSEVTRPDTQAHIPAAALAGDGARDTEPHAAVAEDGEYMLDDTSLSRVLDRARMLAARTDDVTALLDKDSDPPASLSQAIADLPRMLGTCRG